MLLQLALQLLEQLFCIFFRQPDPTAQTNLFHQNDRLGADQYDANGNTLTSGANSYGYDSVDRLISFNNGAVTLAYDGDGNRIAKTAAGVTTHYLTDDLNPTGYAQVVEEISGGAVVRAYTYGLQRISENQQIGGTWTPSFYGYDSDVNGSVRLLTGPDGAVTDRYAFDGFGNILYHSGETYNSYLYRGQAYDPDLGVYYLRARNYQAVFGRFGTPDKIAMLPPIGCFHSDSSDRRLCEAVHHLYLYVNSDPVNNVDPSGRFAESALLTRPSEFFVRAGIALVISAAVVCVLEGTLSILVAEVDGLTNGFDFTLEKSPGVNCFFKERKKISNGRCKWRVHVHPIGTPNHEVARAFNGFGDGKDCATSCPIAKADAYAQAAAEFPGGYHIQHESRFCRD